MLSHINKIKNLIKHSMKPLLSIFCEKIERILSQIHIVLYTILNSFLLLAWLQYSLKKNLVLIVF
jgi:hypothetical protein